MTFWIGSHVSISDGPGGLVETEESWGGNCGQVFAGSPRTWKVSSYTDMDREKHLEAREQLGHGMYMIHSTYLVNLASPKDELFEKSVKCLQEELDAAEKLGMEYVVFHPGAHTGSGRENGIERIAEGIDRLEIPGEVTLLLENTAGKGTTLGKTFGTLRRMIEMADTDSGKIGVCVDTCHAHAAGYELSKRQGFRDMVQELQEDLGLEKVKVIHLNDSKDPKGSEKDNHEHIGEGEIGEDGFRNVVNAEEFRELPMVLETPKEEDRGHARNIEKIKELRE